MQKRRSKNENDQFLLLRSLILGSLLRSRFGRTRNKAQVITRNKAQVILKG